MSDDDAVSLPSLADQLSEVGSGSVEDARRGFYAELSNSSDPMLEEIGQQLQAGALPPYKLLRIPGYDQVVESGLRKLRRAVDALDDDEVRDELARRVSQAVEHKDREDFN